MYGNVAADKAYEAVVAKDEVPNNDPVNEPVIDTLPVIVLNLPILPLTVIPPTPPKIFVEGL